MSEVRPTSFKLTIRQSASNRIRGGIDTTDGPSALFHPRRDAPASVIATISGLFERQLALPWFESLPPVTPEDQRTGWAPKPQRTLATHGRSMRIPRVSKDGVSKVIARVGKAAKVAVDPGDDRTGRPIKYASAQDLRRSRAERLPTANVPQQKSWGACRAAHRGNRHGGITRSAKFEAQHEANALRLLRGTPSGTPSLSEEVHSTSTIARQTRLKQHSS